MRRALGILLIIALLFGVSYFVTEGDIILTITALGLIIVMIGVSILAVWLIR